MTCGAGHTLRAKSFATACGAWLCLCSDSVQGQHLNIDCGDQQVPCFNGNTGHFATIVHTPYLEVDTNEIPESIRDKNRMYLYERVDSNFSARLQYYSSKVIDYKQYEQLKKERGFTNRKLSDKRIKYAFQYYFVVQDSMRYYISTVYDKNGELLSAHQLPKMATNSTFAEIIDVCQARHVAETDTIYKGQVESISLQYAADHNAFAWIVEKTEIRHGREVTMPFVVIHAQTGEIIGHRTEMGVIVCELPCF